MTMITRRDFIIRTGTLLLGLGVGEALLSQLTNPQVAAATPGNSQHPILVVVQLTGGNDGVNTLIPHASGLYYDNRPTIGIQQKQVLALNKDIGLHPSLSGLFGMYQQGKVAVIQGVGYPNPDRSHFRSMDIWHTADPTTHAKNGWLGRYLQDTKKQGDNPVRALEIGSSLSLAMTAADVSVPCIQQITSYRLARDPELLASFKRMYQLDDDAALSSIKVKGNNLILSVEKIQQLQEEAKGYPATNFGQDLATAATIIKGGLGTEVIYTQLGSFDDHAGENNNHPFLLQELDQAIRYFYEDLRKGGWSNRVVLLLFSEFGRRLKENGSGGTDHGTAGPVFMIGDRVKGGLYGEYPSLAALDEGDLRYTMDFRSIYASVIDGYLGGAHKNVLGQTYETLPIFRTGS